MNPPPFLWTCAHTFLEEVLTPGSYLTPFQSNPTGSCCFCSDVNRLIAPAEFQGHHSSREAGRMLSASKVGNRTNST